MKAEEMFEELGFKINTNNEYLINYINRKDNSVITFNKKEKLYGAFYLDYRDDEYLINMKKHKAINQQMFELGWFE